MILSTHLFDEPGPANTKDTLAAAYARALDLEIKQVVVASSHGSTAIKAHQLMAGSGIQIIAVTLSHSFEDLGWCMSQATKADLLSRGIQVVTGIHALGDNLGSAFTEKHGSRTYEEIVRATLYCFSQGMKVAVEDIFMAAATGVLDMTQEVISIAGTSSGADTAIVCKPSYARTFGDFEIREVLAKPRLP